MDDLFDNREKEQFELLGAVRFFTVTYNPAYCISITEVIGAFMQDFYNHQGESSTHLIANLLFICSILPDISSSVRDGNNISLSHLIPSAF